ncbi:MAG: hypothetical protein JST68_07365 [Bacteroidetes bacterium]|nr:hypothetical protein [Bacteroidota bacterium]
MKKTINRPIRDKKDVQKSNDEHIDQDFPGYPHHPAKEKTIHNGSAGAFDATERMEDDEEGKETGDRKY